MQKGTRKINGKYYLLNGRWIGIDAKEQAQATAKRRATEGYLTRAVKMGFLDYAMYEFPKD